MEKAEKWQQNKEKAGPRCCGGSRLLFISAVIMISSDMFPFRSSQHSFPPRRNSTSKKDFFPERSSGTAAAESSACPGDSFYTDAVQRRRNYSVTPCLKIAMSWKPAASDFTFSPEATFRT